MTLYDGQERGCSVLLYTFYMHAWPGYTILVIMHALI